ncbi:MAG: RNA methyltransferase [Bacteroidales bacterium]|nr:RNA methyltransferase [Bacteroidales bacterium]MCM1147644.1 RNA methyltransferase [Bacteroidales bacterium]MCM1206828.1 RNA methyltransferase [Bacillota bacterium]MCM1510728.1 RNA methyltransferase [Clostridium sp.]
MISKAKIKFIRSLENKKIRKEEGLFVAEGPKVIADLMKVSSPKVIVATESWLREQENIFDRQNVEICSVTQDELKKVSFLQHPQQVLAVFKQNIGETLSLRDIISETLLSEGKENLFIGLDSIQDPGNLGTIIRIADWFGIEHVFCSMDTADVWNPKVIQATMGSIARVKVTYCSLHDLIDEIEAYNDSQLPSVIPFPIYGTFLDGTDITMQQLENRGLIIMGNEGNGISPGIAARINKKLLIPNYPKGRETADSLNVAIATAITCFALRR